MSLNEYYTRKREEILQFLNILPTNAHPGPCPVQHPLLSALWDELHESWTNLPLHHKRQRLELVVEAIAEFAKAHPFERGILLLENEHLKEKAAALERQVEELEEARKKLEEQLEGAIQVGVEQAKCLQQAVRVTNNVKVQNNNFHVNGNEGGS